MPASSCHILAAGITDDGIAATTCHTVTTRLLHKTCSCEIMMIVIEINMGRLRLLEGRKKSGYRLHNQNGVHLCIQLHTMFFHLRCFIDLQYSSIGFPVLGFKLSMPDVFVV